jgi:hypothetical protein
MPLQQLSTKELFVLWQNVRDGTLSRPEFVEQMKPIRAEVESLLLRGCFHTRVAGFCKGMWEHPADPVDLCGCGRSRAHKQCCGASVASGGDNVKGITVGSSRPFAASILGRPGVAKGGRK